MPVAVERRSTVRHGGPFGQPDEWQDLDASEAADAGCRDALIAAVDAIADTLQAGAAQSDRDGRLANASVDALRSHGLWRMRLCRELGGFELPITMQIEVLASLAAVDASSAWCTMVANNAAAVLGATMPAAATRRIFAEGVPACSVVAAPAGLATPVEGGYVLNGTWRFASAVHHAQWIHATTHIERDPSRLLKLAIPARDVTLVDSWNVVGLAGTGSNDFMLTEYFLPGELTAPGTDMGSQLRGLRRYDLVDLDYLESYEHLAFAIGIGRRALQELRAGAATAPAGRYALDREVVQRQVGQALVRLGAAEALAASLYARIDGAALGRPQAWSHADRHLPRALAVWATELAGECCQLAFHRSGSAALTRPSMPDKLLRDMGVAAKHVVVDDTAFAFHAQHFVEAGYGAAERLRSAGAGG